VLDNVDESSSLLASLSTVMELLEGWIDKLTTNGVRWGTRFALVAALSHFRELLGSGCNVDLTDD
jgi:hypothetical protein